MVLSSLRSKLKASFTAPSSITRFSVLCNYVGRFPGEDSRIGSSGAVVGASHGHSPPCRLESIYVALRLKLYLGQHLLQLADDSVAAYAEQKMNAAMLGGGDWSSSLAGRHRPRENLARC